MADMPLRFHASYTVTAGLVDLCFLLLLICLIHRYIRITLITGLKTQKP